MKLNITSAHRINPTLLIARIGIALALTTMSGQAKNHPLCTAGDNSQTWTLIDKSAGNHVCIKPGVDWNSYTRFQIEASSFAPANERAVLKTQDAQNLTARLESKLQAKFGDAATANGPAIRIKPTITDVRRCNSMANVIGLMLVRIPLSYGGATVRFDLIDNDTGETIGVITSTRRGHPWNSLQGLTALGHTRVALNGSANGMRHDADHLTSSTESQEANIN